MALTAPKSHRADDVYRTGPESLIAEASTIVAGPVADYSKKVLSVSQPGADGIPLKWVVSGRLENSQVLKGKPPSGAIRFSRSEESLFLPKDPSVADWEMDYGELDSSDQAVLFLGDDASEPILKVLPSGDDERDLIGLIKEIIKVQTKYEAQERTRRWLSYLEHTERDSGRKAALRSLIRKPAKWAELEPVLDRLMANPQVGPGMHAFALGIVAFAVTEERWGASQPRAVGFLCRLFSNETDARLMLQYILSMKQVLVYCNVEAFRDARQAVRQEILGCLKQREARGPVEPSIQAQYQQIRENNSDF